MSDFIIGASYKRIEIHDAWGGQRQGGISTPKDHPVIFLFIADRGSEFGYQDGWHEDGFFHYSGEGQEGDMQEVRGNAAIINYAKNGKQLLVFQTIKDGSRKFIGPMDYVDHYYHEAKVLSLRWKDYYNRIRPHSSLGGRPPAPQSLVSSFA